VRESRKVDSCSESRTVWTLPPSFLTLRRHETLAIPRSFVAACPFSGKFVSPSEASFRLQALARLPPMLRLQLPNEFSINSMRQHHRALPRGVLLASFMGCEGLVQLQNRESPLTAAFARAASSEGFRSRKSRIGIIFRRICIVFLVDRKRRQRAALPTLPDVRAMTITLIQLPLLAARDVAERARARMLSVV